MDAKAIQVWLQRIENLITGIALALMVGCVLWGVITRYITDQPAVWTSELSGILFTWVVFIGAMSAFRKDAHVNVPILVDMLPAGLHRLVSMLSDLFILAFMAFATYLSYVMMLKGATRPSPVMSIPFSYVYLAPLLAFAVMTLHSLIKTWVLVTGRQRCGEEEEVV